MLARRFRILLVLAVALTTLFATSCLTRPPDTSPVAPASSEVPEDLFPLLGELNAMLPTASAGLAVATVEDGRASVVFVGNPDFGEETFFEFGSITKVLTGILLAQAAEEGRIRLDASVNEYLPPEARGGQWRAVT